jgi:hypothetical protein
LPVLTGVNLMSWLAMKVAMPPLDSNSARHLRQPPPHA